MRAEPNTFPIDTATLATIVAVLEVAVTRTDADVAAQLRAGLSWLSLTVALGSAAELASLRHWGSAQQLVPWVAVTALALGAAALVTRRSPAVVVAARSAGILAVLSGGYGVLVHASVNLGSAVLDSRYADTWTGLSLLQQMWLAVSGGVGPTPSLAPGMLAVGGVCLLLATLGLRARSTSVT